MVAEKLKNQLSPKTKWNSIPKITAKGRVRRNKSKTGIPPSTIRVINKLAARLSAERETGRSRRA